MTSDNFVQTFQLESTNLRGRIVKLGGVLDDILNAHDYPLPVAHLVAENITLAIALSSMLKYDGIFTLQANGDGPLHMLVSDVTSQGIVRGCASFDSERFENSRAQVSALKTTESAQNHLAQYLGKGRIAFTVDQGGGSDRYQGIVELKGSSLIDCVRHYFTQSEQIGTGIKMAVGQRDGLWRASAIMLQHMPEDEKNAQAGLGNLNEDDWRRTMILMDSCTEDEFLDKDLDSDELLFRLFHEDGVRVYDRKEINKGCRCDETRVQNILYSMDESDVDYMDKDGIIAMTCEFCSKTYEFNTDDVLKNMKENKNGKS